MTSPCISFPGAAKAVSSARRFAVAGLLFACATAYAAPEDAAALLDHVVEPREAIDLCSTNAWQFAAVTNGTAWDDPAIQWQNVVVPKRHFWGVWDKPPKPNQGYYRRTFTLTPEQAAKRGRLCFEIVAPQCEVRVNGRTAHFNADATAPFQCDVSPHLRAGENTLEVRLYQGERDGKKVPGAVGWIDGMFFGLSRPVHLELFDAVHLVEVRLETKVSRAKRLFADVVVTNSTERPAVVALAAAIEGGSLSLAAPASTVPPRASTTIRLEADWPEARLWSPADPFLHHIVISLRRDNAANPCDALRLRFGFREFGLDGNRLMLNGRPFMNRRDSVSLGNTSDNVVDVSTERMRETIALLKKRGFVGARVGTHTLAREARIADEEGFLLSVLPSTGAAYRRLDPYWTATSNRVGNIVRTFRNHPSIVYWGLFNEFGQFYGLANAAEQTPKTVEICRYAESLDPTRFWCSHGDAEMGVPASGPGPSAIRSLHYPINLSWGGNDFPEIAYWYAEGRPSWQGVSPLAKPLFISEDLYHGMNDNAACMGKWAGDDIYEAEGYIRAWRNAVEMLADGYYYAGVGEWNPWYTSSTIATNALFSDGPLMPDFLISRRHGFPNVASNAEFEDSLHVFNERFHSFECTLTRVDAFDGVPVGKPIVERFTLDPGERRDGTLRFHVPHVKGPLPSRYTVAFTLTSGAETLATRTFAFNVLPAPADYPMPDATVLVDYCTNASPVRMLFPADHIFTNAVSIPADASSVVVTGPMPRDEKLALDNWVVSGGQVLLLVGDDAGGSPIGIDSYKGHAYAWRRTPGFLPDVDNSLWSVWRPRANLGQCAIVKDASLDVEFLVDSCHGRGFTHADIVRLPRGDRGGSWLVTSLPVASCFVEEPAAAYLATRLAHDQAARARLGVKAARNGVYAFLSPDHPYADAFRQNGFPPPVDVKRHKAAVLIADGSRPLTPGEAESLLDHARSGGSVILAETTETNRFFLASLGLGIHPRGADFFFRGSGHILSPFGSRYVEKLKDPNAPRIYAGDKPFTPEDKAEITDLLENCGRLCIMHVCPENRSFIVQASSDWREANRDWFTRKGTPRLLVGIANSDLFFSRIDLAAYFQWMTTQGNEKRGTDYPDPRLGLYPEQEPVSHGALYTLPSSGKDSAPSAKIRDVGHPAFLLHPAVMADIPVGSGHVYVSTLDFNRIRQQYPQRFIFLWRQFLGNLGVRTSDNAEPVQYVPAQFTANARLWDDPAVTNAIPVVFANGDDLRYFPVNLCGWSLSSNNKCPVEPFPLEPQVYGGIPFSIREPQAKSGGISAAYCTNGVGSAAVGPPKGGLRVRRVWVLAALESPPADAKQRIGELPVIDSLWQNNINPWHKSDSKAYFGRHVGAYREPIALSGAGRIGWEGRTGKGGKGALYVFPLDNPWDASIPVKFILVRGCRGIDVAIFGVTFELE